MINHKPFKVQFWYHPLHQSKKDRYLFWISLPYISPEISTIQH